MNALRENAKFRKECDAPAAVPGGTAEYKQVTVLFADVVRSMEIAAAVDTERLREIMTDLVDRVTAVVRHYGGTMDKFTGDGVAYRDLACRYRTMAESLGFEGHLAWAEAMIEGGE